ncbi:F0F1 ATP synthase subunit B' [Candidatus Odyssella thessalonicensis]|uniref:F0F1 ATP synthase subunit B family protein n=1 Tax=Candidatus Odyssella thessalonicensis TaxID=84647 RepID=UPI000225A908|nr:F0F1 ATP synthase subunit B' [Candidatus Odyssella thessalonicensis]
MPQLDVSTFPSQIFWLVVCFALLCFAMVAFLVPRLSQVMANRAATLEELRQKTEQLTLEASRLNHINEKNLQAAKAEVHSKIKQSMTELAKLKEEKLHEFEARLQSHLNQTQQQLNQHKQEILSSSEEIVQHLVKDMYRSLTQQDPESSPSAPAKNL